MHSYEIGTRSHIFCLRLAYDSNALGFYLPYLKGEVPIFAALKTLLRQFMGAQWLSGRVLDSRPRGHGFESLSGWCHCVVVLEQDTFILA